MMGELSQSQGKRRYGIIGTGAIGGFYGAKLQQAGFEVHFLLHRDYDAVRDRGLIVESVDGDFTLNPVHAYNDVHQMPPCDAVVVALKTTRNDLLPQLLPPVMKDSGVAILLQNGLGSEELAAEAVGSDRVMGGLCFICSNKVGEGHIRHLDYGYINFAEYAANYQPQGITDRMRHIGEDFKQAGIPVQFSEDLLLARWKKLVWNIPFNGLSVVLDAKTDALMGNPHTRTLAAQLMQEVVAGAAAFGREIPPSFLDSMLDHTVKMKPYLTSMKLDCDRAQPLEVEAIFGNPLRAAASQGVQLPKIDMLYQQLKFIDATLR